MKLKSGDKVVRVGDSWRDVIEWGVYEVDSLDGVCEGVYLKGLGRYSYRPESFRKVKGPGDPKKIGDIMEYKGEYYITEELCVTNPCDHCDAQKECYYTRRVCKGGVVFDCFKVIFKKYTPPNLKTKKKDTDIVIEEIREEVRDLIQAYEEGFRSREKVIESQKKLIESLDKEIQELKQSQKKLYLYDYSGLHDDSMRLVKGVEIFGYGFRQGIHPEVKIIEEGLKIPYTNVVNRVDYLDTLMKDALGRRFYTHREFIRSK